MSATLRLKAAHHLRSIRGLRHMHSAHELAAGAYAGVPAFIVGAGPSLDLNRHLLPECRVRGLVLVSNTAAPAVGEHAHAIAVAETLDVASQITPGIPVLVAPVAHDSVWRLPAAKVVPVGYGVQGGTGVVAMCVDSARHLGCDPIVLIGVDGAYDGERVYASGTAWERCTARVVGDAVHLDVTDKLRLYDGVPDRDPGAVRRRVVRAAWGGRGEAITDNILASGHDALAALAPGINAAEGGAHIAGWTDTPLADVLSALPRIPVAPLDALPPFPVAAYRERVAQAGRRAHRDAMMALRKRNPPWPGTVPQIVTEIALGSLPDEDVPPRRMWTAIRDAAREVIGALA